MQKKQDENFTEQEQLEILKRFVHEMGQNMVDIDPEIQEIINQDFWEMYENF